MSGKLQSVHLRINDAGTGKPTPVRIRITDPQGNYHAPLGRLREFPIGPGEHVGGNTIIEGEAWAYIEGACEILLPPGKLRVRVHKGFEYQPLDTEVTLVDGKLALRLEIQRIADLRAEGWYAGDVACYDLSPHAALLEGAGEDLAVVNLLTYAQPEHLSNILAFSGQKPSLEQPGTMVVVNSRNDSPLGRLVLLHCHRVVYPLSFELGPEVWTLDDWCQQCHRKKGLVIAENYFSAGATEEMTAQIVLGQIDAILYEPGQPLDAWMTLLNAGIRIPLIAGSRKGAHRSTLGSWRTYAHIPADQPFTYGGWIEAIRMGRTWSTCGPIMRFQAEAEKQGEEPLVARILNEKGELLAFSSPNYNQMPMPSDPAFLNARQILRDRLNASRAKAIATQFTLEKQQTHLLEILSKAVAKLAQ